MGKGKMKLIWLLLCGYMTAGYGETMGSGRFHLVTFYVSLAVIFLVCIILFYALIRFRRSKGNHFHPKLGVELLWTAIPIIILLALAIPTILLLQQG